MKIYHLLTLLLSALCFTQCQLKDDMELNKGSKTFEITLPSSTIELNAANPDGEALRITWTAASNNGTNAGISYTFQMDKQGNNFAGGIKDSLGRGVYEKIFKNEELNNLLTGTFSATAGSEVDLEVRVVAKVLGLKYVEQISLVKHIKVITHTPISSKLYLIGDATPNGWANDKATEMKAISGKAKNFTWTGALKKGEFKFITTLNQWKPAYCKGDTDTSLRYVEGDDSYDEKFKITESGRYTVNVDLIAKTIKIVKGAGPEYTELFFVGEENSWGFTSMTVDPIDPFTFHYNAVFTKGGEFKIGTVKGNYDADFFRPKKNGQGVGTNLDVVKSAGDPDDKWNIKPGAYKITLDIKSMKISIEAFTPTKVYLIGNATPAGWSPADAVEMSATTDPYTTTWEGTLKTGELKFLTDPSKEWDSDFFLASEENKTPTGSEELMHFSKKGSNPDNKWKISEEGTYKITLNQLTHKIIIKKQ